MLQMLRVIHEGLDWNIKEKSESNLRYLKKSV